jgi:hypothetical protein
MVGVRCWGKSTSVSWGMLMFFVMQLRVSSLGTQVETRHVGEGNGRNAGSCCGLALGNAGGVRSSCGEENLLCEPERAIRDGGSRHQ